MNTTTAAPAADRMAAFLARVGIATLVESARTLAAKPQRTNAENITFAKMMGEVMRRAGHTLDTTRYRADIATYGPVDAALIQLAT